jgi:hypothetical protein
LLFRGGDRVGGYLQHTHAHGQGIQQQKLLQARQAVLAEKTIGLRVDECGGFVNGGGAAIAEESGLFGIVAIPVS